MLIFYMPAHNLDALGRNAAKLGIEVKSKINFQSSRRVG